MTTSSVESRVLPSASQEGCCWQVKTSKHTAMVKTKSFDWHQNYQYTRYKIQNHHIWIFWITCVSTPTLLCRIWWLQLQCMGQHEGWESRYCFLSTLHIWKNRLKHSVLLCFANKWKTVCPITGIRHRHISNWAMFCIDIRNSPSLVHPRQRIIYTDS